MGKGNAMAIFVFVADGHPAFMKGIAEKLRKEKNLAVAIADGQGIHAVRFDEPKKSSGTYLYSRRSATFEKCGGILLLK